MTVTCGPAVLRHADLPGDPLTTTMLVESIFDLLLFVLSDFCGAQTTILYKDAVKRCCHFVDLFVDRPCAHARRQATRC